MITLLGTIRGINLKSKVDETNRTVHHIGINLEITDGVEHVQEIVEQVRKIVKIGITPVQPTLETSIQPPLDHKDD